MAPKYKMVFSTVDRYPTEGTIDIFDTSIFLKKRSKVDTKAMVTTKKRKKSASTLQVPVKAIAREKA